MRPSDAALSVLYGKDTATLEAQRARYEALAERFARQFDTAGAPRFFSAPGRAELGGNHTDHQQGRVLAASVNLDTVAAALPNDDLVIRIDSEGFARFEVSLQTLSPQPDEVNTTPALVRGCAARMRQLGLPVGGFDAAVTSSVFGGSGLSSSAAFEVLIIRILDGLYGSGGMSPVLRAQIAQYAENEFFGKPSGLLDQMASSVGGIVTVDFLPEVPEVSALRYDFAAQGYTLAVVNTRGSHGDLTDEYTAIRREMEAVAAQFGKSFLRDVDPAAFDDAVPRLRGKVSDRALLRAYHFFDEDARVPEMVAALDKNDLGSFLRLVNASGDSSWKMLQNVWASPDDQPIALALALAARMLRGEGAWRVHGGGFAGTILTFLPRPKYAAFCARMDAVFGEGACCPLRIRPVGAVEVNETDISRSL